MRDGTHSGRTWRCIEPDTGAQKQAAHSFHRERKWCHPEKHAVCASDNILISRWLDLRTTPRSEEAITPPDRYLIGVALKPTRLALVRGRRTIFDGIMPVGSLYIGTPSSRLSAQLNAPCDFLHLYVRSTEFRIWRSSAQLSLTDDLNDLVLLRDRFAEQIAKILIEHKGIADETFTCCIGQTLAMHLARQEIPRVSVGALPKWRLRRVEDYIKDHFNHPITLFELAAVAGLSRMHFAAQFRAATGYRPREYLARERIEYAKSLLSGSEMPLAEIALAAGFCTQAHFSTVFKRITEKTPAGWRRSSLD
ncbi:AraC family transcriptional regulator [Bradyrhizobium sp. cf659]|uniref:AraC family transcriptional regulator n=1 Tax=Bradyrhizobium sp. cf659 TaxID=1761771 RepID=UPI0008E1D476|nr:AraC family transcriptional regulator [Bradyrhizobium sp. cf659]SFI75743.1 AraC-type DNA-binding protein [Bradyrhizobium sp. cf659]